MKRNVSVVRFKFRCNILISGKIIKEMPGSVASGTDCIKEWHLNTIHEKEMKLHLLTALFINQLNNFLCKTNIGENNLLFLVTSWYRMGGEPLLQAGTASFVSAFRLT